MLHLTEADLIGTWSVDARYGPAAMEDCVLYFGPDRLGCLAWANLVGVEGSTFAWRLRDGALTTVTMAEFSGDLKGVARSEEGLDLDLMDAQISVALEDTPAGESMRVLRLPSGTVAGMGDEFGFVGTDPTGAVTLILAATSPT